ncbi:MULTISPECIES: enoyl-ACP reductase FabI [Thalassobaculum]|uniref:Enoyl-[acyl-carrier-protein] reductase [NADH] n=1 Tax=Thalassobaculum litoreum DSM 18839 TaxID=1123362 RepID=A0A8G2BJR6_9PROT|nr:MULTISPECIES: enoyl-ACP reductase [Thalassobaculum]SDF76581.1 Enoyl-[acyl-carrier-protein] reductase [NADH] [Thalassobaculum litoreum DSM 18839]
MSDSPSPQPIMAGKRGLIIGVANDRSIAWGIAAALAEHGAELAFTYQNESIERRVRPLAESVGADIVLPCDVTDHESLDAVVAQIKDRWGGLDFALHAVAYSDKAELKGKYYDTSRTNFINTMDVSCYSFTALAQRLAPLMSEGGSLLTLSYLGAERSTPNYNVMGVAKAALEASVRYLAADLGPDGIRVNALSAGPMRTLAGSAIADARYTFRFSENAAPLGRNAALEEVGRTGMYLLSRLSSGVTGEVVHVDGGFHSVAIPHPSRREGNKGEG